MDAKRAAEEIIAFANNMVDEGKVVNESGEPITRLDMLSILIDVANKYDAKFMTEGNDDR